MESCEDSICPICGGPAKLEYQHDTNYEIFICDNCGHYKFRREEESVFLLDGKKSFKKTHHDECAFRKLKCSLFYYLRVIKKNHLEETLLSRNRYPLKIFEETLNEEELYNLYPKTFSKRIDMILEVLSTFIDDIGKTFTVNRKSKNLTYNMLFLKNDNAQIADGTLTLLKSMGFVFCPTGNLGDRITFTPKGWEKINSLQHNKKSQTVFVAMSFDKEDQHVKSAKSAIIEAIKKAKYTPIITNEIEYNQSIPEEIEYEIKQSAFVVSELIQQNNGAYYEAGFAKGIGKDVIFTCYQNDFKHIHFDASHMNIIVWENEQELVKQLYNRIKYTVGVYE